MVMICAFATAKSGVLCSFNLQLISLRLEDQHYSFSNWLHFGKKTAEALLLSLSSLLLDGGIVSRVVDHFLLYTKVNTP
jgi:hypothetical protein